MGDKTLNLQQFFAMSFGLSVENLYYIAIAVLACVLGAEIAGICVLVGKMRRAKSEKADASNDEYNRGGGANYALAALSFGAVSATAELALLVLAIAAAVGAFVLCVLLIVLRAKGYLLISAKDERAAEEQKAATPAYAPVEVPEQVSVTEEEARPEPAPEVDYVQPYQDDAEAQKAIANLINTEDAVLSEDVTEEAPTEEATVEEAPVEVAQAEAPAEASVEEPSEGLVVEIAEVSSDDPLILTENVDEEALEEALHTPDVELKEIEYEKLEEVRTEDGVEVISVVWPERAHKNKVYRYDPDGEKLDSGDIVLVPSRDKERNRDIIRKAAVAEGNHRVDPASLHHPLKKIIGVVRRHAERMLTPDEYKKKEK